MATYKVNAQTSTDLLIKTAGFHLVTRRWRGRRKTALDAVMS